MLELRFCLYQHRNYSNHCIWDFRVTLYRRHGDNVEVFLTEFSSLEVGAAHRPLPAQFLRQLQRWPQEAGMQATSAITLYKGHELHVDDEAPPNSLAKVICVWEGPDDMELRVRVK